MFSFFHTFIHLLFHSIGYLFHDKFIYYSIQLVIYSMMSSFIIPFNWLSIPWWVHLLFHSIGYLLHDEFIYSFIISLYLYNKAGQTRGPNGYPRGNLDKNKINIIFFNSMGISGLTLVVYIIRDVYNGY